MTENQNPEQKARGTIDAQLKQAGWVVQSAKKKITKMAYGAGKPGLNLENIRSVVVPVPALSEQEKIVELIEGKLSEVDQLEQTLAASLQQTDALRQSILKKAFSGQLVPQNPADEPAARLLERIRAERERTGNRKSGRSR